MVQALMTTFVSRVKQFQACSIILAKGTQVLLQRRYLGTILERCVGVNSLLSKLQLIFPCSASLLGLNLIAAPVGQSNCSYSAFRLLATCRQAARIPTFCLLARSLPFSC